MEPEVVLFFLCSPAVPKNKPFARYLKEAASDGTLVRGGHPRSSGKAQSCC